MTAREEIATPLGSLYNEILEWIVVSTFGAVVFYAVERSYAELAISATVTTILALILRWFWGAGSKFRQKLLWAASATCGLPIIYVIEWNIERLLVSTALVFTIFVALAWDFRHKLRLRDKANAPRAQVRGVNRSRIAYVGANALTYLRPAIGIAAGYEMAHARVVPAFALFFTGLLSDVLDGMIARLFHVQSAEGREWDAMADVIHNFSFGLGLAWFAAHRQPQDSVRLGILIGIVVFFALSRKLVDLHSVADKLLSGLWRVILFVLAALLLPSTLQTAAIVGGLVLLVVGGTYEIGVMRADLRLGRRVLRKQKSRNAG